MKVRFSQETDDDFKKYQDYLMQIRKSDGHKYQSYELNGITKSLKKNIAKGLESKKEHPNSIYPKEFEYNSENYKMKTLVMTN